MISKMLVATGAAALLVASSALGASAAGQEKTDVCHSHGDGSFDLITVADPAIDSHIAHGDALIGDAVPGQPGFVFDEACIAIPEPVQDPFLRALAWQDLNENGRYDEGTDNLIAKLRDENGVPEVTTATFNDGLYVYPATVTSHTGTAVTQLVDGYRVDDQTNGNVFIFQANETLERYFERNRIPGGLNPITSLYDYQDDTLYDVVTLGSDSPSLPDLDGEDGEYYSFNFGNEPFIEVSIFFPTP